MRLDAHDRTDLHEWVSIDVRDEDRTWLFDLTFLTSNWTCIFGDGCQGVLTEPAPELVQGCCSYGAHFTDKDDRKQSRAVAERLDDDEWQFKKKAEKRGGPIYKNDDGECGHPARRRGLHLPEPARLPGGPGCALHRAALRRGERPLDWKPDVCWQLPLRLEEKTDDNGHGTSTLREWKRRDWGEGGSSSTGGAPRHPTRSSADRPGLRALRDEIVELDRRGALRRPRRLPGREGAASGCCRIRRPSPRRPRHLTRPSRRNRASACLS